MPRVLLIQCKSGKAKLSKRGKADLIELTESIGGMAVYAYRPSPKRIEMEKLSGLLNKKGSQLATLSKSDSLNN